MHPTSHNSKLSLSSSSSLSSSLPPPLSLFWRPLFYFNSHYIIVFLYFTKFNYFYYIHFKRNQNIKKIHITQHWASTYNVHWLSHSASNTMTNFFTVILKPDYSTLQLVTHVHMIIYCHVIALTKAVFSPAPFTMRTTVTYDTLISFHVILKHFSRLNAKVNN